MDIQVGDRVTFDNRLVIIIYDSNQIKGWDEEKIVKIERPKYEVIKEKKELLTKEEKNLLKSYIEWIKGLNNGKIVNIYRQGSWIVLNLKTQLDYSIEIGARFNGMVNNYRYSMTELGLEEN